MSSSPRGSVLGLRVLTVQGNVLKSRVWPLLSSTGAPGTTAWRGRRGSQGDSALLGGVCSGFASGSPQDQLSFILFQGPHCTEKGEATFCDSDWLADGIIYRILSLIVLVLRRCAGCSESLGVHSLSPQQPCEAGLCYSDLMEGNGIRSPSCTVEPGCSVTLDSTAETSDT